ncbi:MAG: hypothetical protein BWY68_00848 [bacterium ADurb.Bin400]|nr:MAG: hypothetical protein BWY68_00848 [bacterium ADurb.Bin400]
MESSFRGFAPEELNPEFRAHLIEKTREKIRSFTEKQFNVDSESVIDVTGPDKNGDFYANITHNAFGNAPGSTVSYRFTVAVDGSMQYYPVNWRNTKYWDINHLRHQ